ncbi:NAD(P)H-quinone oxidoreductase [Virgibacillus senegalensis]|uniref:NAD(P)H-quinone oxidoreductase n=1 Tax=Virgibacillus senegalensis TaxID=1499679 RepID=UPI00069D3D7F|nr:NAD(P)H-quinone oxidoreductase [Virgibacillus senegalensis]
MKAITVKQPGGADQLQLSERSIPEPKDGELLIKVKAAAINRTDIINRQSSSGYLDLDVLGIEVAGVVESAGNGTSIEPGTKVMGLVNGGGYADYAIMPANRAMLIPDNLSFEEAAAIPEVFLTAYQTLFWLGELKDQETVLIHAGGSGVGTAAIQLARELAADAHIITTAGTQEKLDFCRSLGADVTINYKQQSFDEEVLAATQQQGTDVILDFIGASYYRKNLNSIKVDGRWILIGVLGGTQLENVNLMELMNKRVHLKATLLTPRPDQYKADLTADFASKTLALFEQNQLKPVIDKVYPMEDVQEAHRRMESNQNIGKILLKMD